MKRDLSATTLSFAFAIFAVCAAQLLGRFSPNTGNNIAMAQTRPPLRTAQDTLKATIPATVTVVVVPSGDAEQTAQASEQLGRLLEQETGYAVHTFVSSCYGAAVDAMALGEADVGWLPAVTYVLAHDRFGILVVLVTQRFGATSYRSQFIVRSDSGINDLGGLAGKSFAFVDPLSASGFLYPALHISNTLGISYSTYFSQTVFVGSHNAVVEAVYNGQTDSTPIQGGATYADARWSVIDKYPDVFTKTKVLSYTDYIPNDTVSVRPGLDAVVAQHVISGLLEIAGTPEGSNALHDLYGIEGLQPTEDSAYAIVRQAIAAFGLKYETCSQASEVTQTSGGSLDYVDSKGLTTTVQIPPGAVSDTVQLSYTPLPAITYSPAGLSEIGHAFDLKAIISRTDQILTSPSAPYTVTVIYSESELGLVSEDTLALYWWDGAQWRRELTSAVDPLKNTVRAMPNHFSLFAVLGRRQVYLPVVLKS